MEWESSTLLRKWAQGFRTRKGALGKAGPALCHPSTGDRALSSPCFSYQTQKPTGSLGQHISNNSWFLLAEHEGLIPRRAIPPGTTPRELTGLGKDVCCTVLFQLKALSWGHKGSCWPVHDDLPNKLLLLWCVLWNRIHCNKPVLQV